MQSGRAWPAVLLVIHAILSIIFIIGFSTPNWAVREDSGGISLHYGLWKLCYYYPSSTCVDYTELYGFVGASVRHRGGQATACLALVMLVVSCGAILVWLVRHPNASRAHNWWEVLTAGFCWFAAGVCAFISVVLFGIQYERHVLHGWSAWLVLISAIFDLICGLITMIHSSKLPYHGQIATPQQMQQVYNLQPGGAQQVVYTQYTGPNTNQGIIQPGQQLLQPTFTQETTTCNMPAKTTQPNKPAQTQAANV